MEWMLKAGMISWAQPQTKEIEPSDFLPHEPDPVLTTFTKGGIRLEPNTSGRSIILPAKFYEMVYTKAINGRITGRYFRLKK